jgi:NAD(P)-dependent dehydrogenase (short-subunit alcohol dehydrogenase family)
MAAANCANGRHDDPSTLLTGHLALVTGAGGGVGCAIAKAYAAAGADLVLLGRDQDKVRALGGQPEFAGRQLKVLSLDLSLQHSVEDLRRALRSKEDRLPDLLVNNAGIGQGVARIPVRSVLDVEQTFWELMFATNVQGPLLLMQALLPEMVSKQSGRIINITSRLAYRAVPGSAPYGPSKAALDQLTRVVAAEFADAGIRANLLHPGGPVRTGIFTDNWPIPSGAEVADAAIMGPPAVWLASPAAAGINGTTINARTWQGPEEGIQT